MTGVVVEYLDAEAARYDPNAEQCTDCGRHFVASEHHAKGDDHWCPGCKEITPLREQVATALAEHDAPPAQVDVADLIDGGDPR